MIKICIENQEQDFGALVYHHNKIKNRFSRKPIN